MEDYKYLTDALIKLGYSIDSVVLYGKRSLCKAFNNIPKHM
jgi:hypothetical protein